MANIARIRDVYLYSAFNDDVVECLAAKKLLEENNIPFTFLNYNENHEDALVPLKTWWFSPDPSIEAQNRTDAKYPLVHWRNIFDDDSQCLNVAVGLTEIQNSQLIANKDKVVRPS